MTQLVPAGTRTLQRKTALLRCTQPKDNAVKDERPTPKIENQEKTRLALQNWFKAHYAGTDSANIPALNIPASTGMSNVTLLFDVELIQQGRKTVFPVVGRIQPQVERPLFPEYDLQAQYRTMEILGAKTTVPAPPLLGYEADASILGVPFYFMERLEGLIPSDMPPYHMDGWMVQATPEQRAHVWNLGIDAMAALHNTDSNALGFDYLKRSADGKTGLDQQLAYWNRYMQWATDGIELKIHQRAYNWLIANKPQNEVEKLCWGDSRLGNVMYTPDMENVAAVLDWEMATFGNPLQDLAWWNVIDRGFSEAIGVQRLLGVPGYEETLERWHKATGLSKDNYYYYEVFAGWRFALILSRVMYSTNQHDQLQEHFFAKLLEQILDSGNK